MLLDLIIISWSPNQIFFTRFVFWKDSTNTLFHAQLAQQILDGLYKQVQKFIILIFRIPANGSRYIFNDSHTTQYILIIEKKNKI